MKYLKDWLERLKSRPASGNYWENHRRHEACKALAACGDTNDWLTLSTHGNGFVREIAVRKLSEQSSPAALAALLERVNDWVPQVRELAVTAVQRYLIPEQAPALLHALPQLMALAERQRADHGPTLAAARAALQAPEVRKGVEASFVARHGQAARFLFDLLLEVSDEPANLLRTALAHREMTVCQMAVPACQALPTEQAHSLLLDALKNPGASVQVSVLRSLLTRLDDPQEVLRDALLAASPSVRNLARWAAPRWQIEPREVLETRLRQPIPKRKREWLGVLGLACELAVELDEPWCSSALLSPMSSVRLAAVAGLADTQLREQLAALDDPADKVFAKAVERLSKQLWTVLQTELDDRLDRDWHSLPAARRAALMNLRPRWQQLAYLLRRLDANPEEQDSWLKLIAAWCQWQYVVIDPTTAKADRERLIARVRDLENSGALPDGCAARLS